MKRFIITLLTFSMIVMLGACSKAETSNMDNNDKETEETTDSNVEEDETETEEPASTEEETEEKAKQAQGEIPDFGTLSDDIYSFQVEINGNLHQFPMKYTDFISYGWDYKDEDNEKLDSYYQLTGSFDNNGLTCRASVVNFDINARPISECYVASIRIDRHSTNKADSFSLKLPKGIEYDKATLEDVKEAYGTPSDTYDGDSTIALTYKLKTYQEVKIGVSKETNTIDSVEVRNLVEPEDFVESEASTDIPEIVSKYKAPEKLDNSFDTFTVEFGEDLYQVPAPVSSFVNNGWKVNEDDSEETISGRGSGFISLIKDNQRLRVLCKNYSEGATAIENCFVTIIKSGDSDNNTKIVIPQNLTIGSSEADLEKAIAGVEHEKDDSSDSYTYYRIIPGESTLDNYEIIVSDGTIDKIEVNNSPKHSEFTK